MAWNIGHPQASAAGRRSFVAAIAAPVHKTLPMVNKFETRRRPNARQRR
jgi:hypothetical protein